MKGNFYIFCSSKNSRHVVIYIFKISRSINHLRIHHFLKLRFYQHYLRYTVGQGSSIRIKRHFGLSEYISYLRRHHLGAFTFTSDEVFKVVQVLSLRGVITPTSM